MEFLGLGKSSRFARVVLQLPGEIEDVDFIGWSVQKNFKNEFQISKLGCFPVWMEVSNLESQSPTRNERGHPKKSTPVDFWINLSRFRAETK
jgi:hypothetical protein